MATVVKAPAKTAATSKAATKKAAAAKKLSAKKPAASKAATKKTVAKTAAGRKLAVPPGGVGANIQLGHALTNGTRPLTIRQFQIASVPGNGVIIGPVPGRIPADLGLYRTVYSISLHGGAVIADVAIRFRAR